MVDGISEYKCLKLIGGGSSANIFSALDIHYNFVCLKVKKLDDMMLYKEYELLKELEHKHIIKPISYIPAPETIVFPYYPNGDLLEYVNMVGPFPELKTKLIYGQLISTIEYIHNKGYAHLDIKLENILIEEVNPLTIKLADFGFATKYDEKKTFSLGSISYAAPEIMLKIPVRGPELDVWSSGIVLYGLLMGKLPITLSVDYKKSQIRDAYNNIESKLLKLCKHTIELQNLLRKILVVDSEKRASIQDILKHPWWTKLYLDSVNFVGISLSADSPTP